MNQFSKQTDICSLLSRSKTMIRMHNGPPVPSTLATWLDGADDMLPNEDESGDHNRFLLHPRLLKQSNHSLDAPKLYASRTRYAKGDCRTKVTSKSALNTPTGGRRRGSSISGGVRAATTTGILSDRNSQPPLSPSPSSHRKSNHGLTMNVVNKQTEREFEKKTENLAQKNMDMLRSIRNVLEKGVSPPDGSEDYFRRVRRVQEFGTRFSRTYLYPLRRQVDDLMTYDKTKDKEYALHKLLVCQHAIAQALQTYLSHLPTSYGHCAADKLQLLLNQAATVYNMQQKIRKNKDDVVYAEALIKHVEILQETISKVGAPKDVTVHGALIAHKRPKSGSAFEHIRRSSGRRRGSNHHHNHHHHHHHHHRHHHHRHHHGEGQPPLVTQHQENSEEVNGSHSAGHQRPSVHNKTLIKNSNGVDNRYSMYTESALNARQDAPWKRTVEMLAKKKFNVASRYKTATYKHRPPMDKMLNIVSLPKKNQLFPVRSSSSLLKSVESQHTTTPTGDGSSKKPTTTASLSNRRQLLHDDSVETMIELDGKLINEMDGSDAVNEGDYQEFPIDDPDIQQSPVSQSPPPIISQEELRRTVNMLKGYQMLQPENPGNSVKPNAARIQNRKGTALTVKQQHHDTKGESTITGPIINVGGAKNAALICMKHVDEIKPSNKLNKSDDPDTKINGSCLAMTTSNNLQVEDVFIVADTDLKRLEINNNNHNPHPDAKISYASHCNKTKVVPPPSQKPGRRAPILRKRPHHVHRILNALPKDMTIRIIQHKLELGRTLKSHHLYTKGACVHPMQLIDTFTSDILQELLQDVVNELEMNTVLENIYLSELQY